MAIAIEEKGVDVAVDLTSDLLSDRVEVVVIDDEDADGGMREERGHDVGGVDDSDETGSETRSEEERVSLMWKDGKRCFDFFFWRAQSRVNKKKCCYWGSDR